VQTKSKKRKKVIPSSSRAAPSAVAATLIEGADDLAFLKSKEPPAWLDSREVVRLVDLFCGCGGMTLGVSEAARRSGRRVEHVLGCDFSDSQLAVYSSNFGPASVRKEDLSGLSSLLGSSMTPVELKLFRPLAGSSIDFLLAGPPCQGHSNLNNHTRRNDPKNELYFKVARAAELLSPQHILIENVPGVIRDHGAAVARTEEALRELGYSVNHEVLDLTKIGVAQTRKRHVMVATKSNLSEDELKFERLLGQYFVPVRPLSWAISDLAGNIDQGMMGQLPEMAPQTLDRVNYLFDNDLYNLPDEQRPDCHREKAHTYQSVYGRMKWEKPAPTLTSGFMTVGRGRFLHPSERRTLTPREAARVQFIPDYFSFAALSSKKAIADAIGNAVPPKMSMVFAAALLAASTTKTGD
jgi:DNA (cytosine-5)-methyltransferase 1